MAHPFDTYSKLKSMFDMFYRKDELFYGDMFSLFNATALLLVISESFIGKI